MVCDVGEGVIILPLCLQWGVRRVVSQVQEERPVAVGFDYLDRVATEIVGHVGVRPKSPAVIVSNCVTQIRPQESIDRIKILFGVNHLVVVLKHKQGGSG